MRPLNISLCPQLCGSDPSSEDEALNGTLIHDFCIILKLCLELRKKLKVQYLENAGISCLWIVTLIFTDTYILKDRQRKLFIITDLESFPSLHFAVPVCNKSLLFLHNFLLLVQWWNEQVHYLFQQFTMLSLFLFLI